MPRSLKYRQHLTAPTGHARSANSGLKRFASAVGIVTLSLTLLTLAFANSLATEGGTRAEIEQEIARLSTENSDLRSQVANQTSVSKIYERALSLGFVNPKLLEKVSSVQPVAFKDR
ncbi:MAG TPA: hypothetical protein VFK94_03830 [Patescibacteria group bacterium]|nr:hypothetical protein [Patescibacteria group bacterium]